MSELLKTELLRIFSEIPELNLKTPELPEKINSKERLFETSPDELSVLFGENGAAFISLAAAIASRRVTEGFKAGCKYTDEELEKLVTAIFIGANVECVYMISLDGSGRFISCDFINEGTVNYSDVVPVKMLERAKRRRAASVIIAHNHPRGEPAPSAADFSSTLVINVIMRDSGIRLLAHYIVAGGAVRKITPDMLDAAKA